MVNQKKPLDLLAIEAFAWSPHLETAGEYCVTQSRAGLNVGFSYIDVDNPDVRLHHRFLGGTARRKARALERALLQEGIKVFRPKRVDCSKCPDAITFTRSRPKTMASLRALRYRGAELGMGVASSLITEICDSEPDLEQEFLLLSRYLRASVSVYKTSLRLIQELRPKRILVFNGRFACAKAIVEAAVKENVPYIFHERGATYDRYEIFEESPHDFSFIRKKIREVWEAAPDPDRTIIAQEFFRRRQLGDGIGWHSFTNDQTPGLVPERVRPRRLVFFSSSDDEYAAVGDLMRRLIFSSQREAISFLINWIASQEDQELLIRVHPNIRNKSARMRDWWDGLRGSNVKVIKSQDPIDSYSLARSADLVLTDSSTMGAESAFMGRPVILLGDAYYREFGCVYEPQNIDALLALLGRRDLHALPREGCLPFGYYHYTFGIKHQIYSPKDLFKGSFLGSELSPELGIIRAYRGSRFGEWIRPLSRIRNFKRQLGRFGESLS